MQKRAGKHWLLMFGIMVPGLLGVMASGSATAQAARLRSPWDDRQIALTDAAYACPAIPAFARTTEVESAYIDSHYSIIDPVKEVAEEKADEPLTHLGQYAVRAADAYLAHGSRQAAQCTYALLTAAAKADAWTGKMPHRQGIYDQNWLLSGVAIAYLKVRNTGVGTAGEDAEIAAWMARLAVPVEVYFDQQLTHPGSDAYNNHLYWAGLSLCAQGIVGNHKAGFLWGMNAYRHGVEAIRGDGSLMAEMNRAGRALHYQLYALGPLVMLAEFGEANGIDLYAERNGALHRLVRFDVAAIEAPERIVKAVGVAQDYKPPASGLEIGWAVPYAARFPYAAKSLNLAEKIAAAPWVNFWQWGGAPPEPVLPRPALSAEDAAFEAQLKHDVAAEYARVFPENRAAESAIAGDWCTMGDPASHDTIARSADGLIATTDHGDSSQARVLQTEKDKAAEIVAPGWLSVTGALDKSGTQIDWSNGTFWERCSAIHPAKQPLSLSGAWYGNVDFSQPCDVKQHGMRLTMACGKFGDATGELHADGSLDTDWSGRQIAGVVTPDGRHILWANQTYWTAARRAARLWPPLTPVAR
ncbi:alginate lyase family protein [Silvibacterium dinghuense]|uniref:Alginate lyase domain-containing protein n=1 Tax=Silvibacterium dinghuense TaxID=1560006 RepID=A0A4Q1SIX3_9BACT|nr:alginate lyase family protein [Silvibacterium dinghuense]RXS97365.1 hypothetical protein ESZ00_05520 [Silvibacterium dinghuense]GGG98413.1 hypothetical protein GCM10011586_12240 [Silvibacterium dinghuense]